MANGPGSSPEAVEKTWMPTTAGILSLVAGAIDVILGILVAAWAETVGILSGFWGLGALGVPLIILGAVAIIGGIYALQRRVWGLALAGAICALIWPFSILGLLAVVFVALSKQEFS